MQARGYNGEEPSTTVEADPVHTPRSTAQAPIEQRTRAETTRIIEKTHHITEKTQNLTTLIIGAAASGLVLIVTVSLMIGNWRIYISSMSMLLQLLVWALAIGLPGIALVFCVRYAVRGALSVARETTDLLNAQAERKRLNDLNTADIAVRMAEAKRIEAEASQIQHSVIFDSQGNAALYNPQTLHITQLYGQMREHPNLSSMHYAVKENPQAVGAIAPPQTPVPLTLPGRMLMVDVIKQWDLRLDNLLLGYGKGMQPIACTLEGFMHVAHDAPTGGGKTSQFYAEIGMLLKLNVQTILANPHFAPVSKKGDDWRPIARAIEAQGRIEVAPNVFLPGLIRKFSNIAAILKWLATQEIDRRFTMQLQGDYSYQPIYLFIDEWPAIVSNTPEVTDYMATILQRGRAVEVCVDANSQGFLQDDVDLGGSARENFNTAYHMGGSVYSGSKLLDMPVKDMNALMKQEQVVLGKGVALLRNNETAPKAQLVRLPYANNDYGYYLFGRADNWVLPEFRGKQSSDYRDATMPHNLPTSSGEDNYGGGESAQAQGSWPGVPSTLASERLYLPNGERPQNRAVGHDSDETGSYSIRQTGPLLNGAEEPVETTGDTPEELPALSLKDDDLQLDDLQIRLFVTYYEDCRNIETSLARIKNDKGKGLGKHYYRHASWIVKQRGLSKKEGR